MTNMKNRERYKCLACGNVSEYVFGELLTCGDCGSTDLQTREAVHHSQNLPLNNSSDMVERPKHYIGKFGLEVKEVIENFLWDEPWLTQAVQYILRCRNKGNKKQDLEKTLQLIKFELESMERNGE